MIHREKRKINGENPQRNTKNLNSIQVSVSQNLHVSLFVPTYQPLNGNSRLKQDTSTMNISQSISVILSSYFLFFEIFFFTLARFAQAAKHAKKSSVSHNKYISKLGDLCNFAREITYPKFQYFSLWLRLRYSVFLVPFVVKFPLCTLPNTDKLRQHGMWFKILLAGSRFQCSFRTPP